MGVGSASKRLKAVSEQSCLPGLGLRMVREGGYKGAQSMGGDRTAVTRQEGRMERTMADWWSGDIRQRLIEVGNWIWKWGQVEWRDGT